MHFVNQQWEQKHLSFDTHSFSIDFQEAGRDIEEQEVRGGLCRRELCGRAAGSRSRNGGVSRQSFVVLVTRSAGASVTSCMEESTQDVPNDETWGSTLPGTRMLH